MQIIIPQNGIDKLPLMRSGFTSSLSMDLFDALFHEEKMNGSMVCIHENIITLESRITRRIAFHLQGFVFNISFSILAPASSALL